MRDASPTLATLAAAGLLLLVLLAGLLSRPARRDALLGAAPVSYRIDLNRADADTLCLLPGVGPGIAQRIVNDRAVNGPYDTPADIERVSGIGTKTRQAIEPWAVAD